MIDVRKQFSICLSLEKQRSALQLVAVKTKNILSTITTLGKVSCTPLSIISLYKNSSVLMFPGSSSLNRPISANLAKWHSSSTNELSRSFEYNQSSQTDQPVAYKLVGVGLEKQWTGRWIIIIIYRFLSRHVVTSQAVQLASRADACLTHACIKIKS